MKIEDLQTAQKVTPINFELKKGYHYLCRDVVNTHLETTVYNLKELCFFEPSVVVVQVASYVKRDGDLHVILSPTFFRYWPNQTTLRKLGLRPDHVVVFDANNTYRHE